MMSAEHSARILYSTLGKPVDTILAANVTGTESSERKERILYPNANAKAHASAILIGNYHT